MVKVMVEREYEPAHEEVILQAFKVCMCALVSLPCVARRSDVCACLNFLVSQTLDPQGRGFIPEETMVQLITSNEWAFREKEIEVCS